MSYDVNNYPYSLEMTMVKRWSSYGVHCVIGVTMLVLSLTISSICQLVLDLTGYWNRLVM